MSEDDDERLLKEANAKARAEAISRLEETLKSFRGAALTPQVRDTLKAAICGLLSRRTVDYIGPGAHDFWDVDVCTGDDGTVVMKALPKALRGKQLEMAECSDPGDTYIEAWDVDTGTKARGSNQFEALVNLAKSMTGIGSAIH